MILATTVVLVLADATEQSLVKLIRAQIPLAMQMADEPETGEQGAIQLVEQTAEPEVEQTAEPEVEQTAEPEVEQTAELVAKSRRDSPLSLNQPRSASAQVWLSKLAWMLAGSTET
jgi:hypothetical protein